MGLNPFGYSVVSGSPQPPPQIKPIVASTGDATHDATVATYIAQGYGISNAGTQASHTINGVSITTSQAVADWIGQRIYFSGTGISGSMTYALTLAGLQMVVFSGTGLSGSVANYPVIQLFQPMGSNSHIQIFLTPDTIPNVITNGAGGGTGHNINGFGNAMQFFDNTATASSWSNGTIAGQFLYIKEQVQIAKSRECSWWEVTYRCRTTASLGIAGWTVNDGFGQINVADAIAYAGSVPSNPYPIT